MNANAPGFRSETFRLGGLPAGLRLRGVGFVGEAAGEGDDAHAAELVVAAGDADDLKSRVRRENYFDAALLPRSC